MTDAEETPVEDSKIIQDYQNSKAVIVNKNKSIFQKIIIIVNTRKYQLLFLILILTCLTATFAYFTFTKDEELVESITSTCLINKNYRINCGEVNISSSSCDKIECCYDKETSLCFHSLPSKYGYINDGNNYVPTKDVNPFNGDMLDIELIINNSDADKLDISVKESNKRSVTINLTGDKFNVKFDEKLLGLRIYRSGNTNDILLTTNLGPLIASDGYWEWTLDITNSHLYGLDDFYLSNVTTKKIIYKNSTQHHLVPAFIGHNSDRFHGMIIDHRGPMEITVLPSKLIDIRGLGKEFKISLFIGPTPKDIYKQINGDSQMFNLEMWMLKPHVCRNGNDDITDILQEVLYFREMNTIDFGSDCIHEKLYELLDDMTADDLQNLRNLLENMKEKFLLSLPSQVVANENNVVYKSAKDLDILYKYLNAIAVGSHGKKKVAYVDFANSKSSDWIEQLKINLQDKFGGLPHGLTLTDNWLIDDTFIMKNSDIFPYWNDDFENAMSLILRWNATTTEKLQHYLIHNNYALAQTEAYEKVENMKVFATSSYTNGIKYVANMQTLSATWSSFKKSLNILLSHSLFGNPYIAIPVCGSIGDFDQTLCIRWYLMAATMPIFRISSNKPRRDPGNLSSATAQKYATEIVIKRQQFLPYYYKILKGNQPLVRPMFYEFPNDDETYTLDEQYMLGGFLLVAHPVLPLANSINVYLPREIKNWYEIWSGRNYGNGWIEFPILESDWNMFIASGYILPLLMSNEQNVIMLKLIIALDCTDIPCQSSGSFSYNGYDFTFTSDEDDLYIQSDNVECTEEVYQVQHIFLYGVGEDLHASRYDVEINLCDVADIKKFPYK